LPPNLSVGRSTLVGVTSLTFDDGFDTKSLEDAGIRRLVTSAALRAAQAATAAGLAPEQRVRALMECHGSLMAARGPGSALTFGQFREALKGDLAGLLPSGVQPLDLDGLQLVDQDGLVTEDAFDLDQEQQMLLLVLRKYGKAAGAVSEAEFRSEVEQETAFVQLRKPGDQGVYVAGRSDLIRCPAGAISELSDLRLPPLVADFYREVPFAAQYEGWWFPCPVCRWPMRVALHKNPLGSLQGKVRCWHGPHAEMGASYLFQPPTGGTAPILHPELAAGRPIGRESVLYPAVDTVPVALPVSGHKAVARGIWRYTTVPGLPELALYERLAERGLAVQLWPSLDAFDLLVEAGRKRGKKTRFKVDVKDYTSATTLAELIHAQEGDKGGADWLVVPDHRAGQVPLLSGVCAKYEMKVTTASQFGEMVCEISGVQWA
jgi:hypothetical protein